MDIGAENQQAEKEKTGSGKPKGCLPLSMERRDGRMGIGAEKQEVEKEKTGLGKPKGCLPWSMERHDSG